MHFTLWNICNHFRLAFNYGSPASIRGIPGQLPSPGKEALLLAPSGSSSLFLGLYHVASSKVSTRRHPDVASRLLGALNDVHDKPTPTKASRPWYKESCDKRRSCYRYHWSRPLLPHLSLSFSLASSVCSSFFALLSARRASFVSLLQRLCYFTLLRLELPAQAR